MSDLINIADNGIEFSDKNLLDLALSELDFLTKNYPDDPPKTAQSLVNCLPVHLPPHVEIRLIKALLKGTSFTN